MRLQLRTVSASMPAVAVLTLIVVKNVELSRVHPFLGPYFVMELVGIELLLFPLALCIAVRFGRIPRRAAANVFAVVVILQFYGPCAISVLAPFFR